MSDLAIRTIVGIVGILFLLFVLYLGGPYLLVLLYAFTLIALYELKRAFANKDIELNYLFSTIIISLIYLELLLFNNIELSIKISIFIFSIEILCKVDSIKTLAINTFSIFYLVNGFTSLYLVKDLRLTVLIFILAFSTDTFAYLIGLSLGRHKLAPKISPNKSVEGALGGVLGAVIVSCIYMRHFDFNLNLFTMIMLSIIGSLLGQAGDLFASKIKRELEIKDFGKLLPGHGGILDRFDSILFIAPYIYIISKVI